MLLALNEIPSKSDLKHRRMVFLLQNFDKQSFTSFNQPFLGSIKSLFY